MIKGQKGFSLTETMVGLGILSAIGVGGLYLSSMQKKSLLTSKTDVNHAVIILREHMGNASACQRNFLNKKINSEEMNTLLNGNGDVLLTKGQEVEEGNFKVTGIRLREYHPEILRTILEISFTNVKRGDQTSFNKRIGILSRVDSSGKIVECLDPAKMSLEVMIKTLCRDADPKDVGDCEKNYTNLLAETKRLYCENNPNQPFLSYDHSSGNCRPIDADVSCAGSFVKGYDADGNLLCSAAMGGTSGSTSGTTGTTGTTTGGTPGGGKILKWVIACFVPGTQVTMASGHTRNIEDVTVGEMVLTYDEITNSFTRSQVREILHHEAAPAILYDFTFSDGTQVTSNDVHLFYVVDYNNYFSAKDLHSLWLSKTPVSLISSSGRPVQILQMKERKTVTKLYNLHVVSPYDSTNSESFYGHNYFAGGVLVHNEKAESTLESVLAGPAGLCCKAPDIDYGYPRKATCSGTADEKAAYFDCVNKGGP